MMPGLRDILDAATRGPWVYHSFEDDGYLVEDVRPEDRQAIIAYGEKCFLPEMETANLHLAALAPELAALALDMGKALSRAGELLHHEECGHAIEPDDSIEAQAKIDALLARLDQLGKEQT